jgi:hypothetical protein
VDYFVVCGIDSRFDLANDVRADSEGEFVGSVAIPWCVGACKSHPPSSSPKDVEKEPLRQSYSAHVLQHYPEKRGWNTFDGEATVMVRARFKLCFVGLSMR